MFAIMIFVILSLYAGKTRKLNIGVNIFAGRANVIAVHIPNATDHGRGCKL